MSMALNLTSEAQHALDVVKDVAGKALREERARFDLEDGWIRLIPTDPDACPVGILPSSRQIDLAVGPEKWNHEIWQREEAERLRQLRLCLSAVIAGDYEEELRTEETRFLWWHWETTHFTATFRTDEGDITFSHHGLGPDNEGREKRRAFAAY
jgi:hypothetical protein